MANPSQQQQPQVAAGQPNAFERGFEKTMAKAHPWFDKHRGFFDKVGDRVNNLSNKVGAEAFWPTTLDKESDKAARILRSFCIDGFEAQQSKHDKKKSLQRIPPEVIRNCKGLAIFTVMRTGLHLSGAGGSGVIVKKMPNGQWSPPSAIVIHTLGVGVVAGADIYDCVAVINNDKGMEGFTGMRATIGGEISAAVGPLGGGKQLESEIASGRQAPVWTYTKSRGLYVGVQIDGTVIAERMGENQKFYGVEKVRHAQILSGQVQPRPGAAVQLWETLQAAEGLQFDPRQLPPPYEAVPGDQFVEPPKEESRREYNEYAYPEEKSGHDKS